MKPPERGDVVWIDFDPQSDREQAGRRPALVLTPARYNRLVGLLVACPVTKQAKGYPFESPFPPGLAIEGVVLTGFALHEYAGAVGRVVHDWLCRCRERGRAPCMPSPVR